MRDGWGAEEQWDYSGEYSDGSGDGFGSEDGFGNGFTADLVWSSDGSGSAADPPEAIRDNRESVQDSAETEERESIPEAQEKGILVPTVEDDPLEIELDEVVKTTELLGQQTEEKLDVIVGSFDTVTRNLQLYTEQDAQDTQSILDTLSSIETELGNVKGYVINIQNTVESIDGNIESIKDNMSTLVYYAIANSNYEAQVKTYWEMGIGLVAMMAGGFFAYVLLRRLLT